MFSRFGLRSKMAVSYVAVSAAAVLVVEAVLILAVLIPGFRSAEATVRDARQRAAQAEVTTTQTKVDTRAVVTATRVGAAASLAASGKPDSSDHDLLVEGARTGLQRDETLSVLAVAMANGQVVASTGTGALPEQSRLPVAAVGLAPLSGTTVVDGTGAIWVSRPVTMTNATGQVRALGIVYAVTIVPQDTPSAGSQNATATSEQLGSFVLTGITVLVLLLPVGTLFGLLSTRRLIRRVKRLADGTTAMADGDLGARIEVSGGDEVGQLERSFNAMAERIEAGVTSERVAAAVAARRAERTRIARELHDSISQHLFSAGLLAGGLRKALPVDSDLRRRAESMEQTLQRTTREMRAMLLQIRPVDKEGAGLAASVSELCGAYETRLGIIISTEIGPLQLTPPVEHAVLRVVQEALGNAVRHGEPERIELLVSEEEGQIVVVVRDNGVGFEPEKVREQHGMGLELMRERVGELGGTVEVASAPQQGTTVRVLFPAGVA